MTTRRRRLASVTYSKITGRAVHRSQGKKERQFRLVRPNAMAFKYRAMTYLIKERLIHDIPGAITRNIPIGAEPEKAEEIYAQAVIDEPEETYEEVKEFIPPITPADDPNSSFYDDDTMPKSAKPPRKERKKKKISALEDDDEEDLDEIIAQKVNDDGYYGELLPSDIDEIFVKPRKKVELWKFAVIGLLLILGITIIIINIKNLIG